MTDIYHNASLVTVWLGESDKYADEAIVLIKLTVHLQRSGEWNGGNATSCRLYSACPFIRFVQVRLEVIRPSQLLLSPLVAPCLG